MAMTEEFIAIGKIVNTQGRRGAVRVFPLTDYPERFKDTSRVWVSIKGARQQLSIGEAALYKNYVIIEFKEITDMKDAEALKGGILEVPRGELVALPEDNYYIFDIVGLQVYDAGGDLLGKITDVLHTGANDVYVVETGGKPLLIPALKQVVREIDLDSRRMVVELPKGLVDA